MEAKQQIERAFKFSPSSQEVRSLLIENEPWFVAKDICDILELSDTNMALAKLDEDEKLTQKVFGSGQNRKMWLVNESGLYALILRSNKPEARTFRKWITKEVLPSIRKNGFYGGSRKKDVYVDARDIPPSHTTINGFNVCTMVLDENYYSLNDLHRAIRSGTSASQAAKKLNAKKTLAKKIHIFGGTNPEWFTNAIGMQLIISGSRVLRSVDQLKLTL